MDRNILIFTGGGKGKTTAALGMALRAAGHGQRVLIVQFIKGDPSTGELAALRRDMGIEVVQTGLGFVPRPDNPEYQRHREAAEKGFMLAAGALASGDYDLIVLDEICGAVAKGLLEEGRVMEAVGEAAGPVSVVLTGRGASERMIAMADTVTEMRSVKHALEAGIPARKGVEF